MNIYITGEEYDNNNSNNNKKKKNERSEYVLGTGQTHWSLTDLT